MGLTQTQTNPYSGAGSMEGGPSKCLGHKPGVEALELVLWLGMSWVSLKELHKEFKCARHGGARL